ncbi:MAG: T9SS type A sorting domain-containing protein [Saprospiraceae bacterium]|nr:T9SS type A sorting domain-containing protein [Saprospiraceae bacterium]
MLIEWFNSNGSLGVTTNNTVVTSGGTYTVVVTNSLGCTKSFSININEDKTPPLPTISQNGIITCTNSMATLTATPNIGVSYQWNTGATSQSIQVSEASIYTVVVTNISNGCTSSNEAIVYVDNSIPIITMNSNSTVCRGAEMQLFVDGGANYHWSGPAGFISDLQNPTRLNTLSTYAGYYHVTVTNLNGCTSNSSMYVAVSPNIITILSATPTHLNCYNPSTTLSATYNAAWTYEWFNSNGSIGVTTYNTIVSSGGMYTVVVTNSLGCTKSFSININEDKTPPLPTISQNGIITCTNSMATLTATPNIGVTYQWNAGATSQSIQVSEASIYTVVVTNISNGCTSSVYYQVVADNIPPLAQAGESGSICEGDNVNLTANGGVSYQWSGPDGFTSNDQNPTILDAQLINSGTYSVMVTNGAGCSSSSSVQIEVRTDCGSNSSNTCTLGGTVWFDYNSSSLPADGLQNTSINLNGSTYNETNSVINNTIFGEQMTNGSTFTWIGGASGVNISLVNSETNELVSTTLSSSFGNYEFSNLVCQSYYVMFDIINIGSIAGQIPAGTIANNPDDETDMYDSDALITFGTIYSTESSPTILVQGTPDYNTDFGLIFGTLPINLEYFKGLGKDCSIDLEWATSLEKNNKYFVIERSLDGIKYTELGKLVGLQNSVLETKYHFKDDKIAASGYYYRLKQIDNDGTATIFESIFVSSDCQKYTQIGIAGIYPNPVQGNQNAIIKYNSNIQSNAQLAITTADGKILRAQQILLSEGLNTIAIDLSSLPGAVYFVQIYGQGLPLSVKKVIKTE